ncbi:unnamed protein product [Cylicocyclus nassatus]|uniref:Uncharacterized protein n=1 Tax=Cylicocyclus nassatus TaxID=53992 RepID=A0AA36DQ44_CYLNA|nr:unnamed protein product [Cylicocyclus nassatus]
MWVVKALLRFQAILCIRAAYSDCDDDYLDPEVRTRLRKVLLKKESQYDCELEERAADFISTYTLHCDPEKPLNVTKLVGSLNYYEKSFLHKATYFKSQNELYDHMKNVKEDVGCANLPQKPYGYICLIEESLFVEDLIGPW